MGLSRDETILALSGITVAAVLVDRGIRDYPQNCVDIISGSFGIDMHRPFSGGVVGPTKTFDMFPSRCSTARLVDEPHIQSWANSRRNDRGAENPRLRESILQLRIKSASYHFLRS